MIKMNPKFKAKVKEELMKLDLKPIFHERRFFPIEAYSDTHSYLSAIIFSNKGYLRLNNYLYMNDNVMYYINDDTKEYYSIPENIWAPRITYILKYNLTKRYTRLAIAELIDSNLLTQIMHLYDNSTNITITKESVLAEKNILINLISSLSAGAIFISIKDPEVTQKEGSLLDICNSVVDYHLKQKLDKNIETFNPNSADHRFLMELRILLLENVSLYLLYNLVMNFYFDHYTATMGFKNLTEWQSYTIHSIFEYFILGINRRFGFVDSSKEMYQDDELSRNVLKQIMINLDDVFRFYIDDITSYETLINSLMKMHERVLPILATNFHHDSEKLAAIFPLSFFDSIQTEETNQIPMNISIVGFYPLTHSSYIIPRCSDPLIENTKYAEMLSSKTSSDVYCSFLSNKYINDNNDILEHHIKTFNNITLFITEGFELLFRSFKNISLLFKMYHPTSSNTYISEYRISNIRLLDPKNEDDEELFNTYYYKNKAIISNKREFELRYEQHYADFYSGKTLTFLITTEDNEFTPAIVTMYNKMFTVIGLHPANEIFEDKANYLEVVNGRFDTISHIAGFTTHDMIGLDTAYYKASYINAWFVYTVMYYLNELAIYLNEKKQDGSISMKLVEVEETYDKKRKSSSFTIHERKGSWVRAHYRHYKSGVVTLVTAHSRKGTNVTNDRLVLNL